mmetsp:Transcript_46941/g.100196  ORF Transcript_46941/g.100196 Transcript_46941/m.100196 type:complete len:220 (-) Transcript_46941:491-1150(-)
MQSRRLALAANPTVSATSALAALTNATTAVVASAIPATILNVHRVVRGRPAWLVQGRHAADQDQWHHNGGLLRLRRQPRHRRAPRHQRHHDFWVWDSYLVMPSGYRPLGGAIAPAASRRQLALGLRRMAHRRVHQRWRWRRQWASACRAQFQLDVARLAMGLDRQPGRAVVRPLNPRHARFGRADQGLLARAHGLRHSWPPRRFWHLQAGLVVLRLLDT